MSFCCFALVTLAAAPPKFSDLRRRTSANTVVSPSCSTKSISPKRQKTITLAALMKEFVVEELVTLSRQLAYCESTFRGSGRIDSDVREMLHRAFLDACPSLINLGLQNTLSLCETFFQRTLREELSDDQFSEAANQIFRLFQNEASGVICFKTDEDYTHIVNGDEPIPEYVRDRFAKCVYELEESARCILYERGTASVFHSMRAIEVVLKATWKTLGLTPFKLADSWGNLLTPLEEQLARPPKNPHPVWQANLSFFSEVVHDIRAVKRPYRDTTMHVESTYGLPDARAIFNASKTLIRHAAKQLDQDGNFLPLP